jgi:fatty acid amide hydrolase
MNDTVFWNATDIAASVSKGEVSCAEVVDSHIQRIELVNPKLNAVVIPLFDQAMKEAKAADERRSRGEALGPLHGVPITVKEIFDLVGTPSSGGVIGRTAKSSTDAAQVARLRAAGAIVLGKTNLSQLMIYVETDNPVYGRTNNPWNLERSPGGSSGGEAAILASGGSALGLGADIGGSVRNPAHCCGVFGFMPTADRVNRSGEWDPNGRPGGIQSQPGPLARSVADLTLAVRIMCQPAGDYTPTQALSWTPPESIAIRGLRVGAYNDNGLFPASQGVRRAVGLAAQALQEQGAEVESFVPPDCSEAWKLYFALMTADAAAVQREALGSTKKARQVGMLIQLATLPDGVRPLLSGLANVLGQHRTAVLVQAMHRMSAEGFNQLAAQREAYRQRFLAAMDADKFDVLVCPPFALPALLHGSSAWLTDAISYTTLYNLIGFPAGVVPVTRVRAEETNSRIKSSDIVDRTASTIDKGSEGLPLGVQVVARPWQDEVALATMATLESQFSGRNDYPSRPPI